MAKKHKEVTSDLQRDVRSLKHALLDMENRVSEVSTYSAMKTAVAGHVGGRGGALQGIDASSMQAALSSPAKDKEALTSPSKPVSPVSSNFRKKKAELAAEKLDDDDDDDGRIVAGFGGPMMIPASMAMAAPKSRTKFSN